MSEAIILGSHSLPISACRLNGNQITSFCLVEHYIFPETIRRFTNRSNDIISALLHIRSNILDTMMCLIKCRTNQIGDNGIYRNKLFFDTLLDI